MNEIEKIWMLFLTIFIILLAGCNSLNDSNNNEQENNNTSDSNETASAMVVYFSATGNTEEVAEIIADYIESPIYELEPVEPYTDADLNYSDSSSRVSQERNDPNHLTELKNVTFAEFEETEYIFLGAPIWWGNLSWVINDFVLSNDFTGKTIIPFATSSSSNFSVSNLKHLSDEANWLEGRRFRQSEISEDNIINWLVELNINF